MALQAERSGPTGSGVTAVPSVCVAIFVSEFEVRLQLISFQID